MEVIGAGITRVAHREYAIDYKKSELYDVNAEELDTLRWSKGEAGPDFSEEVRQSFYKGLMGLGFWDKGFWICSM